MQTAIWAYKKLDVLDGRLGIVHCDSLVASPLLKSGDVQDLRDGHSLKKIETCYAAKVMTPTAAKVSEEIKPVDAPVAKPTPAKPKAKK